VTNIEGLNRAYIGAVGRRATVICLSHFMEIIFIQLSDETGHIAVLKMLREDGTREFLILGL
jgi:hypothetical protein